MADIIIHLCGIVMATVMLAIGAGHTGVDSIIILMDLTGVATVTEVMDTVMAMVTETITTPIGEEVI